MEEIVEAIRRALGRGENLVVATICAQEGSSPRAAGTKMALLRDGSAVGTIGGGLLEATVLREAARVQGTGEAVLVPFDLTQTGAADMDMLCGGRLQVLLEAVAAVPGNARVFDLLARRRAGGRNAVLVTALGVEGPGPWPAERCLLADGETAGGLALSVDARRRVEAEAAEARAPFLLTEGSCRFFVEPFTAAARVYFFGAGHVAGETETLARRVGFRTTVLDDRPEFANRERYPDAEEVRCVPAFEGVVEGLALDGDAYAVIMTRAHSSDRVVLEQALRTRAGYIGMIGSRHKQRALYGALREQGVRQEDLDRVHCPIGAEIEAETPAEIAVSIVAELIRERARRGA